MFRNIKNGKGFSQEMIEQFRQFGNLAARRLPEHVAVQLEKVIHDSFEKETYEDGKSGHWKDREKPPNPARKILIGDGKKQNPGHMKNSIEVFHLGNEIKASTDVAYASVHNEGQPAGRGTGFIMPKRQFMPAPGEANTKLDSTIEKWLDTEMDEIFK